MNLINNLSCTKDALFSISSLEENERLYTNHGLCKKYIAPDKYFKESNSPMMKTVRHVLTVAVKLMQAIGRFVRGQTDERNVGFIEGLVGELQESLKASGPADRFYDELKVYGKIELYLKNSIATGLVNYKKTCETGNAALLKETDEKRRKLAERVDQIFKKVRDEIYPEVQKKVAAYEKAVADRDKKVTEDYVAKVLSLKTEKGELAKDFRVSAQAAKQVLSELYSDKILNRALERYKLDKRRVLSSQDLNAILIAVNANLTMEDLKTIYSKKDNKIFNLSAEFLSKAPATFDLLTEEQVGQLLIELRTINFKDILLDKPAKKNPSDKIEKRVALKYSTELAHDKGVLEVCSIVHEYTATADDRILTKDIKKFSYTEYLSHDLIYALFSDETVDFPDGVVFPMFNRKGQMVCKEAHTLISKAGIHGAVFKPIMTPKDATKVYFEVAFRGTYTKNSLVRDISLFEKELFGFEGFGRKSFNQNSESLVQVLKDHIDAVCLEGPEGRKVCLDFMGHSLGGSDAQRKCESLAHFLADSGYDRVGGVNLFAYNSPNIESDKAFRFIQNIEKLSIPFKLRYFDVLHDPIQEMGTRRLGYVRHGFEPPKNLYRSIFRFDRNPAEYMEMMGKNFFSRNIYKAKKGLEAHTCRCLSVHEDLVSKKINQTFIENILTSYSKDASFRYGPKREKVGEVLSDIEMNKHMLTETAHFTRDMYEYGESLKGLVTNAPKFAAGIFKTAVNLGLRPKKKKEQPLVV